MNAQDNSLLTFLPVIAATIICLITLAISFGRLKRSKRTQKNARHDIEDAAHALKQEISFYEDKKAQLAKRADQRRVLSEAARGLGSLLDPATIQEKLKQIAGMLFPSQPIMISYGQQPDEAESYVARRRQALLIPGEAMKGAPLMAVPICAQQSVVGVLRVGGKAPVGSPSFTRDDLRLLEILANLASLAMDNCVLLHNVQQTAIRDNLTGLLTNRAFQGELEQAVLEASRYNQPLSLILVDVDHFKSINDTHGHQAGDAALQGLAHVLDRNARPVDVIARYGGEEFAVLLLQTNHAEALRLAEQIRRDVAEQAFDIGSKNLSITASFGVATFPEDATSGQQLFRQADQYLYKAKRGGRNQVRSKAA